jgi:hypothetical protein
LIIQLRYAGKGIRSSESALAKGDLNHHNVVGARQAQIGRIVNQVGRRMRTSGMALTPDVSLQPLRLSCSTLQSDMKKQDERGRRKKSLPRDKHEN